MSEPVILCPLEIERRAAAKAVGERARVVRCGPGRQNIIRAINDLRDKPPPLVILFGVAGALRYVNMSPRIDRVIDAERGLTWRVNHIMPGNEHPVGVLGTAELVATPGRKRVLRRRFREAALVDNESHAFAESMTTLGVRWTIIRGVSDWPHQYLPRQCARWVTEDGRACGKTLALDLLRRPWLIGDLLSLRSRAKEGLESAADRLSRLLLLEEIYAAVIKQ